jgi:hypothetical protein
VRAGIFRRKPIAFDMPDRTIQAILSAEAWTGLAGTPRAFLTALKHSMIFGIFTPFRARAGAS